MKNRIPIAKEAEKPLTKADVIKITVETVKEYEAEQRLKNKKSRLDWRLRNTRLLLKHYNYFRNHVDESIYCSKQLSTIDALEDIEDYSANINIQSIKKSAQKTFVILSHINAMLDLYEIYCFKTGASEQRKLRVLKAYYFDQMRMVDIAINENVAERTCTRDLFDAINKLSALIFGIDSVHEMVE